MKTCKLCGSISYENDTCFECLDLEKPESCDHSCLIRCPHCGVSTDATNYETDEIFFDSEHIIDCLECMSTFTFHTSASYTFTSPKIEKMSEKCKYCGAEGTKGNPVTLGTDHYAEDIHGDITERWLCEDCRYESAQDILVDSKIH